MNEEMERLIAEISSLIDTVWRRLMRRVREAQGKLSTRLLEYLIALDYEEGKIIETPQNLSRLNVLRAIFENFAELEMNAVGEEFAKDLFDLARKNAAWYELIGIDAELAGRLADDLTMIREKLGVDASGKLIKGGYLSQMAEGAQIKGQNCRLCDTVHVFTQTPQKEFLKGLQQIIKGRTETKRRGAIESFWTSYAYDVPAAVREIQNLKMANELGFNYFIYTGGLIDTSRDFCRKKNGRVFSRDDAEKWVNDPDSNRPENEEYTYKPLIERGRYNCRHFLMWITDDRAEQIKNG
jgi:hypothetical protein